MYKVIDNAGMARLAAIICERIDENRSLCQPNDPVSVFIIVASN